MADQVFQQIINLDGGIGLLVIFLVLLACGLGLPLPEDIPLIASGYLVYLGQANIYSAVIVGMAGVLIGDSIIFFVGRRLGGRLFESRFVRAITTPQTMAKVYGWYDRHGNKTIFFGRFLAGIRAPTFFVAGATKVSFAKFLMIDFVAAAISVPVWIVLGKMFGDSIDELFHWIEKFKTGFSFVLGGLIVLLLALVIKKVRASKKKPLQSPIVIAPVTAKPQRPDQSTHVL